MVVSAPQTGESTPPLVVVTTCGNVKIKVEIAERGSAFPRYSETIE